MKRIAITLICLITSFSITHAELLNFGPRLGASISQLKLRENSGRFTDLKSGWGYQAGVVARVTLPIVHFQPELLVTGSGGKLTRKAQ